MMNQTVFLCQEFSKMRSLRHTVACMQWQNIRHRTRGHHRHPADICVTSLEAIHMRGMLERATVCFRALIPVESSQPCVQAWVVVPYHLEIALEDRVICGVEAYQCWEQTYICVGDMFTEEVGLVGRFGKVLLKTVQRFE